MLVTTRPMPSYPVCELFTQCAVEAVLPVYESTTAVTVGAPIVGITSYACPSYRVRVSPIASRGYTAEPTFAHVVATVATPSGVSGHEELPIRGHHRARIRPVVGGRLWAPNMPLHNRWRCR